MSRVPDQPRDVATKVAGRDGQIRRSSLWAAYGDALGWISEMTNEAGLRRRTGGAPLCKPVAWKRRIGGRAGITASLPVGCYSDDTQLRLATGRAIRPDGFDVEAFAKVELPVWLGYALGAGKSTSAAALNLTKPRTSWFANSFKGWTESGGNGAAMRIQPHVWAARSLEAEEFLPDVVRNTVCTHSHPTGLLGAVLHALSLAHTMATGRHPSPEDLLAVTEVAANLPDIMQSDIETGSYWRTAFERESGAFDEAWSKAIVECREAIQVAGMNPASADPSSYSLIIDRLGLRKPERRGSGMLTAVAAVGLTWCETRPEEALRVAANAIGTDTDTIATMAGAILGVTSESDPPIEVLDADLFRSEADRLAKIAEGGQPKGHRYPDLLHWSAPNARADALTCTKDGALHVRGLGGAKGMSEPIGPPSGGFKWQWIRLETGQTLLIKRRGSLEVHPTEIDAGPETQSTAHASSVARDPQPGETSGQKTDSNRMPNQTVSQPLPETPSGSKPLDLQSAVNYVAMHKDNDKEIGRALRKVANEGTPEEIAGFTAALIALIRQPG